MVLENLQSNERQNMLNERGRIGFGPNEIGQPLVIAAAIVEHSDREIAEAGIFGEHREQRIDRAGAESIADHHAIDVARIEKTRGGLDAERTYEPGPLTERNPQPR